MMNKAKMIVEIMMVKVSLTIAIMDMVNIVQQSSKISVKCCSHYFVILLLVTFLVAVINRISIIVLNFGLCIISKFDMYLTSSVLFFCSLIFLVTNVLVSLSLTNFDSREWCMVCSFLLFL